MKKHLYQLLVVLTTFIALQSCKKDQAHERYIENGNGIKPDLTIKVNATVTGYVMNENDEPVPNAKIMAGNKETLTDEFGYFNITNTSIAEAAGFVKVQKTGYFNGY